MADTVKIEVGWKRPPRKGPKLDTLLRKLKRDRPERAITATRVAMATNTDHAPLMELIEREYKLPRRGRPPEWKARLAAVPAHDLHDAIRHTAAAILYHVNVATLRAENSLMPPLLLSVGHRLGLDLAEDQAPQIGVQLLHLAAKAGIIKPLEDHGAGIHVELENPTEERLKMLARGGAAHILTQVSLNAPTGGAETTLKHSMLLPRAEVSPHVFAAVNRIQATPWRINLDVLGVLESTDVQIELEMHKKLEVLTTIAHARALAHLERFYLRTSLDYRGRLYQLAALNYTSGSDEARGLLEFADGEILDRDGRRWLAWQLAQHWGRDLPHMPLGDGTRWLKAAKALKLNWRDAKHPTQFLAAQRAYAAERSHVPIRLDASCSGLQHLALLARDTDLGKLVNLDGDTHGLARRGAKDRPSKDFYTVVKDHVCAEHPCTTRDQVKAVIVPLLYLAGEDEGALALAKAAGRRRARQSDRDLAVAIRETAKRIAPGAFAVLAWFTQVAVAHNGAVARFKAGRLVVGDAENIPREIRWTTPSGFEPIVDYRVLDEHPERRADRKLQIKLDGHRVNLVKALRLKAIDVRKQEVAFPSAMVHSLDASLLMLIVGALDTERWAVAHDAFGVPASHAWSLTAACEEALAEMYQPDRLAELHAAWVARGVHVPAPPKHRKTLPRRMLGGLRTIS